MSCILCNFNICKEKQFIFCFDCGMCFCRKCQGNNLKKCGYCGRTEKLNLSKIQQFFRMLKFFNTKPRHPNIGVIANYITSCYIEKQEYEKALTYAKVAAHEGIPFPRYFIGWSYLRGKSGLEKNYKLAKHWITIAAEDNLADAFHLLGDMAEREKQYSQALTYYTLGAHEGHEPSIKKIKELSFN